MSVKFTLKNRIKYAFFGVIFGLLGALGLNLVPNLVSDAYAEPVVEDATPVEDDADNASPPVTRSTETDDADESTSDGESSDKAEDGADDDSEKSSTSVDVETCSDQIGALAWFICPGTGVLSKAIDSIYAQIENLLVLNPISTDAESPIFQIWQIMRDVTNIVFVIFLLVIIYSQITGVGITNYGIKKALPKLIIAAILVNLSYLICALAVDASNVIGASLKGLFDNIQAQAINSGNFGDITGVTWTELAAALIGGGTIAGVAISVGGLLWPLLGALLTAIISVLVGLFVLGLRHALVAILIMISPLAMVCYLLPNTEKWFGKWKDIFVSMLVFYPMFSFLYGASALAGWALITSSLKNGSIFGVVIGMAAQVLPLILSIPLMKMSNTVLGNVSRALDNITSKPKDGIRAFTTQRQQLAKNRRINNSVMPSAHLQRFLDKRTRKLELENENAATIRKSNAEVWAQRSLLGSQSYDPAYRNEYMSKESDKRGAKHRLATTRATREAKQAMNLRLAADAATKDTAHVLSSYSDYHHKTAADRTLATTGAKNFGELYRATLAEENDNFADQDFIMGQYEKYRKAWDEDGNTTPEKQYLYKHYIEGSAGSLGEKGDLTVLGEVIQRSAADEAKRRAYTNYVFSKYTYAKSDARYMMAGYYLDDDGFTVDRVTGERLKAPRKGKDGKFITDENGKVLEFGERIPGEFLQNNPQLVGDKSSYDVYDIDPVTGEKQYYFMAKDKDGVPIAKIYKHDTPAMKEILQNWDMPIADQIDSVYGILSGIKEGDLAQYGLDGVGLKGLSTTISRGLGPYKEKNAGAGPMYATSVGHGYITNASQNVAELLSGICKTGKPSSFNAQDGATYATLAQVMNPDNWEDLLLVPGALETLRNVNGNWMTGINLATDKDGNLIQNLDGSYKVDKDNKVPHGQATLKQLQDAYVDKYLNASASRFASLMTRITPNIIDNQKASAQEKWSDLLYQVLSLSDIAERDHLIQDPVLIDKDTMTDEQIAEATKINEEAKKERERKREYVKKNFPFFKDPMACLSNDSIRQATELNSYIRKKRREALKGAGSVSASSGGAATSATRSAALSQRMRASEERANSGMGDLTPEELAAENAKMDAGYEFNFESDFDDEDAEIKATFGSAVDNRPAEERSNYLATIWDLAAQYQDDPQGFCHAAVAYLSEEAVYNDRLNFVISEFEAYFEPRENDLSYTTEDYKAILEELLPLAMLDE